MSDLPKGWVEAPLGKVATTQLGRMLSARRETGANPKPYLRNRDVQWGRINVSDLPVMDFGTKDAEKFILMPGDVLVCEGGEVGRAAIWNDQLAECYYQKALHRVRTSADLLPEFLVYMLEHYAKTRKFEGHTSGSTIAHLPQEDLREILVPLPSIPEQKRIVEAIDEQFSRLNAGLASLERAWTSLRRMRASVYTAAVTGRLTSPVGIPSPVDISRDVPLSLSLTQENARKVKRATEDLLGRVWSIPSTWTWRPATETCEVIASGSTPTQSAMTAGQGEIPYIKVYNLTQRGYLDFSVRPTFIDRATHETTLRRSRLFPGDILMNIVGPPLGKVSVVPGNYPEWNTNQAVVVFRPIKSLHPSLLKYWLLSPLVMKLIQSTAKATAGQYNVSLTTCRALPLPIPPRDDQDLIVASIEERMSMVDSQEEVIQASMSRAVSLRSAILSAAFSGKLI
jgi:type I restriction enzyme, S subunit